MPLSTCLEGGLCRGQNQGEPGWSHNFFVTTALQNPLQVIFSKEKEWSTFVIYFMETLNSFPLGVPGVVTINTHLWNRNIPILDHSCLHHDVSSDRRLCSRPVAGPGVWGPGLSHNHHQSQLQPHQGKTCSLS